MYVYIYLYLSIYLSIYLSVCLSVYLSIFLKKLVKLNSLRLNLVSWSIILKYFKMTSIDGLSAEYNLLHWVEGLGLKLVSWNYQGWK